MTSCAFRHYNESVLSESLWPPCCAVCQRRTPYGKQKSPFLCHHGPLVLLFVLLFVSNRRVDLKTDINKSTSVSVSVEDTVSLSPSVVTTHAYSAGDDAYQAFFKILQNASCYQKFNQNARSYSHDYEAHSITLRFADGSSQNLLFTVYSDGVCQVNGKFVSLRSPNGNAEAIYQLLRDAVV